MQTYFYNQIEHSTDDCQVIDVTDNSHPMRSSILTKMPIVSDPFVKDAHITLTMWWLRLCSPNQASWLMFLKKCIYAKCKSDYLNNNPFFSLKGDAILELTADALHPPSPPQPPLNVSFARSKMLIIVEYGGMGKRVYYSNLFENLKTLTIKVHFFFSLKSNPFLGKKLPSLVLVMTLI